MVQLACADGGRREVLLIRSCHWWIWSLCGGGAFALVVGASRYFLGLSSLGAAVPWWQWGGLTLAAGLFLQSLLGMRQTAKLHSFRSLALLLLLLGSGLIFVSFLPVWLSWLWLAVGALSLTLSLGIYTFVGTLSLSAPQVFCAVCAKKTKVIGQRDRCLYCRARLSLDPRDRSVAKG